MRQYMYMLPEQRSSSLTWLDGGERQKQERLRATQTTTKDASLRHGVLLYIAMAKIDAPRTRCNYRVYKALCSLCTRINSRL